MPAAAEALRLLLSAGGSDKVTVEIGVGVGEVEAEAEVEAGLSRSSNRMGALLNRSARLLT